MNPLNLVTDAYDRQARLYPALLLIAPVVAAVVALTAAKLTGFESLAVGIVGMGGSFLLTQLARDAGKKGERKLFELWGGLPSIVIFRYRDSRLDAITKVRYHKKLATLVKEAKAPTPEEEQADPTAADNVYSAWSTYLRVNTRDTKKHSLLFQENVSYGYRRNVWGLRPIGIASSLLAGAVCFVIVYLDHKETGAIDRSQLAAGAFSTVMFLLWSFRFSSAWVRVPADAYAARLAECAEILGTKGAASNKGGSKK